MMTMCTYVGKHLRLNDDQKDMNIEPQSLSPTTSPKLFDRQHL